MESFLRSPRWAEPQTRSILPSHYREPRQGAGQFYRFSFPLAAPCALMPSFHSCQFLPLQRLHFGTARLGRTRFTTALGRPLVLEFSSFPRSDEPQILSILPSPYPEHRQGAGRFYRFSFPLAAPCRWVVPSCHS